MLGKEDIDKIRADFPPESVQLRRSFKNPETGKQTILTGYKPQYIFERLNDTFGHESWDFIIKDFGKEEQQVWVLGQLTIFVSKFDKDALDGPIIRKVMTVKEQFGFGAQNKMTPLGDAYKAAATNSCEKCASLLDIGHKAYKGLLKVPTQHPESEGIISEEVKDKLAKICKQYKIDKKTFPDFVKNVLKEKIEGKDLTSEQMGQLINHLEKNKAPF